MSNVLKSAVSTIRNWWVFLLMGILFIVGGVYVFQTPEESYVALAWLFSILVLLNGISTVYFSISNKEFIKGWGWYVAGGIFEIILGIVLLNYPDLSMLLLPLFLGFWLLFRGAQMMGAALDLKELYVLDWGWVMIFGIVVFITAFFMLLNPLFAFFNVIYFTVIGLFAMGIGNIMLAFKLKKVKGETIDKVDEAKHQLRDQVKILRDEVEAGIEDEEVKKSVHDIFKKFLHKLK